MRKFDLSLRSSRSSYFATFRHQLTILSKTDALDEEKWLNMLGTFVKDWFRYESHFVHGRDSLVDILKERGLLSESDAVQQYPRFPAPVEFIAAVIAYYVHPVNIQTACLIMEGAEFTENIINGVERPVKAAELFAFTLRVRAGNTDVLTDAEENVRQKLRAEGVM